MANNSDQSASPSSSDSKANIPRISINGELEPSSFFDQSFVLKPEKYKTGKERAFSIEKQVFKKPPTAFSFADSKKSGNANNWAFRKQYRQPVECRFHPYSEFKRQWDTLVFIAGLLNIVMVPCIASFYESNPTKLGRFLLLILDLVFIFDVWITMNCGYITFLSGRRSISMTKKCTRDKYFGMELFIDLLSSVPLDLLCILLSISRIPSTGSTFVLEPKTRKVISQLFLLRLLRLKKLIKIIKTWNHILSVKFDSISTMLTVLKSVIVLLFWSHLSACLQVYIPGLFDYPETSWVYIRGIHKLTGMQQYQWSMFRSLSQLLCIGYGTLPPRHVCDLIMTTISMLVGAIFYIMFIADLTSFIQNRNNASQNFTCEKYSLESYMGFCKVPFKLRERIENYFDSRFPGIVVDEDILDELNPVLKNKLLDVTYSKVIQNHSVTKTGF